MRCFVRLEGVEPTRPKALDPKSSTSTNSAIAAFWYQNGCKDTPFLKPPNIRIIFFDFFFDDESTYGSTTMHTPSNLQKNNTSDLFSYLFSLYLKSR